MLKDQKSEIEIQKFVSEHIPDFITFLTDVLLEFRGIYLGLINPEISTASPTIRSKVQNSKSAN